MSTTLFDRDNIKLVEDNDGIIRCYFSRELNDEFRTALPSAKWNQLDRCWTVTTRVRKRLVSWAENAVEAAKKARELEELEMQEEDLERLQRLVADLQNEIENRRREASEVKKTIERIEATIKKELEVRDMLRAENEKLLALQQQKEEKMRELEEQRREIDEMLSQIIDLPRLKGVVLNTFAKYHAQVGATAHEMFDRAQAEFREAREKLRAAGYQLAAIDYLCAANFNRPDRDAVKFMPRGAWWDLSKIEQNSDTD
jgi:DNA repair exonuclease SbcCD ATPase subunit